MCVVMARPLSSARRLAVAKAALELAGHEAMIMTAGR